MSLYNAVFGENPETDILLAALNVSKQDIGRFRNIYVSNGEIALYTRLGGGNRNCYCDDPEENGHCDVFCFVENIELLQNHPQYLRDEDDDFDFTYATFYFAFPPRHAEWLQTLDRGTVDFEGDWKDAFDMLQNASRNDIEAAFPALADLMKEFETVFSKEETENG